MIPRTLTAVAALLLVALAWSVYKDFGVRRELAAARDSLATLRQDYHQREQERNANEDSLRTSNADLYERMVAAEKRAAMHRDSADASQRRLIEILEDEDEPEITEAVEELIAFKDGEIKECNEALDSCKEQLENKNVIIALRDTTIAEKDDLLHGYQVQLDKAVRASRVGVFDWGVRALAAYGIVRIVADVLGGS